MKITPLDLIPVFILLGLFLIGAGFVYDAVFAGIPYQDPTPEMSQRFDYQKMLAIRIMQVGGLTLAGGICGGIISFLASRLLASSRSVLNEK